MASIWITYAWNDNYEGDVDFCAQELEDTGLAVKLDRWNIRAGLRLWPQIETFIQRPSECDAWLLYATVNSLGNEACKEEFVYALDRAIHERGQAFPIIALFPSTVDSSLIPAGIRTRLYVSLTDPDWRERIKAAAEGLEPSISRRQLDPFFLEIYHPIDGIRKRYSIEVRPRAGSWSPFLAAIPFEEQDEVNPSLAFGATGRVPSGSILFHTKRGPSEDEMWWVMIASNEATPTQSYYIMADALPSKILFGIDRSNDQYLVDLQD